MNVYVIHEHDKNIGSLYYIPVQNHFYFTAKEWGYELDLSMYETTEEMLLYYKPEYYTVEQKTLEECPEELTVALYERLLSR